jgi:DNA-binding transcriptional MerR regulator
MSEREFEENARLFSAGDMSRRQFINRLVAGGVSIAAAVAFASACSPGARALLSQRTSGRLYGTYGHVYGNHDDDDRDGDDEEHEKHHHKHHEHEDHKHREHDDDSDDQKRV